MDLDSVAARAQSDSQARLRRARPTPWVHATAAIFAIVTAPAVTRGQAKPEVLLIVDTSRSMPVPTPGPNSCGYPPTRQNDVACLVRNLGDRASADAIFGLATYGLVCNGPAAPYYYSTTPNQGCGNTNCNNAFPASMPSPNPGLNGGFPFPFYGCDDGGRVWVTLQETNASLMRSWGDASFTSCTSAPAPSSTGGPELAANQAMGGASPGDR